MKRSTILTLASIAALALVLTYQSTPAAAAPPPGYPLGGVVAVKGFALPFRYITDVPGGYVYYQVLVPTRTMGPLPFTIGVPGNLPPAAVVPFIQQRANLILGPLPIPLPY